VESGERHHGRTRSHRHDSYRARHDA
jgi:hypothetical protein